DLLLRICMDPLPIPSQQARGVLPAAFDAWFAKAVARDRAARFQSALELATALAEPSPTAGPGATAPPARAALVPSGLRWPRVPASARRSASPRPPSNTEMNAAVGLTGSARRSERRARLAAAVGVGVAAAIGLWAVGNERGTQGALGVEVQSVRPPYEVVPKEIRRVVPSGRRWLPSAAPTGVSSSPSPPARSGAFGRGAPEGEGRSLGSPAPPAAAM